MKFVKKSKQFGRVPIKRLNSKDRIVMPTGSSGRVKEMRDRTMIRDNWNWFVNDEDTKTDFFLRFLNMYTKAQYEKHLLPSSAYSLRIVLLSIYLLTCISIDTTQVTSFPFCVSQFPMTNIYLFISILATTQQFQQRYRSINWVTKIVPVYVASIILIHLIPYQFGIKIVNHYTLYEQTLEEKRLKLEAMREMQPFTEGELDKYQSYCFIVEQFAILQWMMVGIHHICLLLSGCFVVTDWWEYGLLNLFINSLYCIQSSMDDWPVDQRLNKKNFLFINFWFMCLSILLFACNEKIRKEMFIINHTNSKTKKQLMKFFSLATPSMIINMQGQIQMCNESLEKLIRENMQISTMPSNFIRFIQADSDAFDKLNEIINITTRQQNDSDDIDQEFEIVLDKIKIKNSIEPSLASSPSKSQDTMMKGDETNKTIETTVIKESYYDRFVALKVTVTQVNFKSSKSIMFNFDCINDTKAKMRLLALHSRLIGKFVFNNQKRMELLHKNLIDSGSEEIAELVGEFLGNSQVTLNMVQQINYHFNYVSNLDEKKIENYVLSDEIDFCIEGLTASKWEKEMEIYLTKGEMPRKVLGDLTRFRICIRTMLDFGIKYSKDNQMQVKSEFKQYTPERHFVIQFSVILTKNESVDLELLEYLLNEEEDVESNFKDLSFDKGVSKRYPQFYEHIKEFGYGMLVFPSVVKQLKGHYFIQKNALQTDSDATNNNTLSHGKVKIGFKLPFEQASMDSIIQTQNYKINFAKKEIIDGKVQVYKTPQIKSKTKRLNPIANAQMQQIMINQGVSSKSSKTIDNQIKGHDNSGINGLEPNFNEFNSKLPPNFSAATVQRYQTASAGLRRNPVQESLQIRDMEEEKQNYITQTVNVSKNSLDEEMKKNEIDEAGDKRSAKKQPSKTDTIIENPATIAQPPSISQINSNLNPPKTSSLSLNSKKIVPSVKSLLLKHASNEGKPKQFFGQAAPRAEVKANGFNSIDTSNFKAGQDRQSVDEEDFVMEQKGTQERMDSKNNGSGDFKNVQQNFSFMDASGKNERRQTLSKNSIREDKDKENHNDIRQSNYDMDGQAAPGVKIPASTNMDSLIPDLPPHQRQSDLKDDDSSEKRDVVKSLNQPLSRRERSGNFGSDGTSDGLYNFHMEKIDSFMQSSEQSQIKAQIRDPNQLVKEIYAGVNPKTMLLSKRLYREGCTPFKESTVFASKHLMQQGSVHSESSRSASVTSSIAHAESVAVQPEMQPSPAIVVDPEVAQPMIEVPIVVDPSQIVKEKPEDIFLKGYANQDDFENPYLTNFAHEENQIMTIGFKQYQNTDDKSKDICEDLEAIYFESEVQTEILQKKIKKIQRQANPHDIKIWQMNNLLHPSEFNHGYDAKDRNQGLKNFQAIMDEIELAKKCEDQMTSPQASANHQNLNQSKSKAGPASSPPPTSSKPEEQPAAEQRRQIVLIAEDNKFISQTMQELLNANGVDFVDCADGNQATEAFEEFIKAGNLFDIILMDLYMPLKGGFQTSIEIRILEKQYGVAEKDKHFICAFSAQADLENEKRCFESGMDDIVAKPLKAEYLLRMLKEHDRRVPRTGNTQLSSQNHGSQATPISENRVLSPAIVSKEESKSNAYQTVQDQKK